MKESRFQYAHEMKENRLERIDMQLFVLREDRINQLLKTIALPFPYGIHIFQTLKPSKIKVSLQPNKNLLSYHLPFYIHQIVLSYIAKQRKEKQNCNSSIATDFYKDSSLIQLRKCVTLSVPCSEFISSWVPQQFIALGKDRFPKPAAVQQMQCRLVMRIMHKYGDLHKYCSCIRARFSSHQSLACISPNFSRLQSVKILNMDD